MRKNVDSYLFGVVGGALVVLITISTNLLGLKILDWSNIIASLVAICGVVYSVKQNYRLKENELKQTHSLKIGEMKSEVSIKEIERLKDALSKVVKTAERLSFFNQKLSNIEGIRNVYTDFDRKKDEALEDFSVAYMELMAIVRVHGKSDEADILSKLAAVEKSVLGANASSEYADATITELKVATDTRIENLVKSIDDLES